MKDRQKIFLDKVVKILVGDTRINYEKEKIHFPFSSFSLAFPSLFSSPPLFLLHLHPYLSSSFSDYCRDQFGLTKEEIDYVWKEYKSIIKDKIKNNER